MLIKNSPITNEQVSPDKTARKTELKKAEKGTSGSFTEKMKTMLAGKEGLPEKEDGAVKDGKKISLKNIAAGKKGGQTPVAVKPGIKTTSDKAETVKNSIRLVKLASLAKNEKAEKKSSVRESASAKIKGSAKNVRAEKNDESAESLLTQELQITEGAVSVLEVKKDTADGISEAAASGSSAQKVSDESGVITVAAEKSPAAVKAAAAEKTEKKEKVVAEMESFNIVASSGETDEGPVSVQNTATEEPSLKQGGRRTDQAFQKAAETSTQQENSPKWVIADLSEKASGSARNAINGSEGKTAEKASAGSRLQTSAKNQSSSNSGQNTHSSGQQSGSSGQGSSVNYISLSDNPSAGAGKAGETDAVLNRFQDMLAKDMADGGAREIVKQAKIVLSTQETGDIKLILKPESMGQVRISMNLNENNIVGRIFVENSSIRQIFEQNLGLLGKAFEESGFDSTSWTVGHNSHSDQKERDQDHRQPGFKKSLDEIDRQIPVAAGSIHSDNYINLVV